MVYRFRKHLATRISKSRRGSESLAYDAFLLYCYYRRLFDQQSACDSRTNIVFYFDRTRVSIFLTSESAHESFGGPSQRATSPQIAQLTVSKHSRAYQRNTRDRYILLNLVAVG